MKKTQTTQHKKRPFLLIFLWLALSLACRFGQVLPAAETGGNQTEAGGETAVSPLPFFGKNTQAEPQALPLGASRENPYPPGTIVNLNDWEIEVLETSRGDAAWQEIHLANSNNQQAPEGWEYLLVKMRIKNNSASDDKEYMSVHVTGNGRLLHYSFNNSTVAPDPWLETDLPGSVESIGWETFLVKEDEGNLMFYLEDHENYETPPVYLALTEGSAISIDRQTLLNIPPTTLGATLEEPLPFGQTATGEDWQVIVLDVVQGENAFQTLLDVNQFNDPPPEGMAYVLVYLRVRYIGLEETEQLIRDSDFTLITNSGNEYDSPSVVDPEPELYYQLYAGGEAEGWIVLQAPADAKNLTLKFSPDNSGANDRYFSLGQGR